MTTATEPTTAQIAAVCEAAAEIIKVNGWHRGYFYDGEKFYDGTAMRECPVCALGGINTAVGGHPLIGLASDQRADIAVALADAAAIAVARHLGVGTTPRDLAWWNDELERAQADVVKAFRDTAAELRKGEAA